MEQFFQLNGSVAWEPIPCASLAIPRQEAGTGVPTQSWRGRACSICKKFGQRVFFIYYFGSNRWLGPSGPGSRRQFSNASDRKVS
jgi:hypothetical protein